MKRRFFLQNNEGEIRTTPPIERMANATAHRPTVGDFFYV